MTQATSITTEYQITVSSPIWHRVEQIAGEFNLSVSELLERNLPRDESCHTIISQESMKQYYSARVKEETSA
jgi:hypothetical protein